MILRSFFLLLLLSVVIPGARAANATFTVTFEHPNGVDPSLEYVVEAKQPGGTFVEVAKGPASPIVYAANAAWGLHVVRVFVRTIPPGTRNVALDTSEEASTNLQPGKPRNTTATTNRSAE